MQIHIKCIFTNQSNAAFYIKSEIDLWFTFSCPSIPPSQRYFLFISISCFPIQLLTCVNMYSTKVWEQEKEKDGINEHMCFYLNARRWGRRGQGGFTFLSGLWWKAKIKLPGAAISAVWLSTHLFIFSLSSYLSQSPSFFFSVQLHVCTPSAVSFSHDLCFLPMSSAALMGRSKAINSLHSMGKSRAGRRIRTFTFFWSLSQKKSIPTGRGSCVSACGGEKERAGGETNGGGAGG